MTTKPPPSARGGPGGRTGGDEHDDPRLTPEERAAARAAAEAKLEEARRMEPDISRDVGSVVEANHGTLGRYETRFKDVIQLYRKIQELMAERGLDAELAAEDIRDALRYTAVIGEHEYWARGTEIDQAFEEAGYQQVKRTLGWNTVGYRGRNETFASPTASMSSRCRSIP